MMHVLREDAEFNHYSSRIFRNPIFRRHFLPVNHSVFCVEPPPGRVPGVRTAFPAESSMNCGGPFEVRFRACVSMGKLALRFKLRNSIMGGWTVG